MKHTSKHILAAALLASLSGGAFAQAKNFEGLNVTGSLGYQSGKASATDFNVTTITTSEASPSGMALTFGVEYITALSKTATLGFAVDTNVLTSNGSTMNGYVSGGLEPTSATEFKFKSSYAISVMPGYALSDDLLVYGKLSYVQISASLTDVDGASTSDTVTAYGVGLGFKKLMTKNVFIFGEGNIVSGVAKDGISADGSATYKVKGSATNVAFGIGYKF